MSIYFSLKQEEIREVFEGSCNLIPIKLVRHECIHLADDFIPELIDALASQMNPQVVCATAGLCNSLRVDMQIMEYKVGQSSEKALLDNYDWDVSNNCST